MSKRPYEPDAARVVDNIPNINKLFGKRIFITGGTGMICSAVADILFFLNQMQHADIKVIFAGRNRASLEAKFQGDDWSFVTFDATKPYQTAMNVDYVIYGASNADPSAIATSPVETIMANTSGLIDVFNNVNSSRYLYISSSEIYGNGSKAPYEEHDYGYVDILNPRACYPTSKRLAENTCIAFADEYQKDVVIVRPGHIYGPTISERDSRASAQFSRMAADHDDIVMKSAGTQLRSYCYVYDCASAILAVLLNGENRNAYNISNRDSIVTIREMAESLARAGGSRVIFEEASDAEKKSYNLMDNSSLRSDKLEALGWRAAFDINSGARRTVEVLRDRRNTSKANK